MYPLLDKKKQTFSYCRIVINLFWIAHATHMLAEPDQMLCREEGIKTLRSTYILDAPFFAFLNRLTSTN